MSIRPIEFDDSEYLHKETRPVTFPLSEEVKQGIQDLKDTLEDCETATGVAAPQIGISIAAIVYRIGEIVPPTVMLNPRIVKARDFEEEGKFEMCLSYPHQIYIVPRYKNITVHYQDEEGETYVLKYRGFEARVLQHEIDHLSGLTIADRGEMLDPETTELLLNGAAKGAGEEDDEEESRG